MIFFFLPRVLSTKNQTQIQLNVDISLNQDTNLNSSRYESLTSYVRLNHGSLHNFGIIKSIIVSHATTHSRINLKVLSHGQHSNHTQEINSHEHDFHHAS